ncbi:MAG: alpha/beta hydrolase [bacterium]
MAEIPAEYSNKEYIIRMARELKPKFSYLLNRNVPWHLWHTGFRAKLAEIMGCFPRDRCPLNPRIIETVEEDDYLRHKVSFQSEPDVTVPAYLYIPKDLDQTKKNRALLCLHGHGNGIRDVAGLWTTEEERKWMSDCNYDYARQFARRGYVVLAPEARGFGERRAGSEAGCYIPGVLSIYLGITVIGQRAWDDMRAIDYLSSLNYVDGNRIGALGLSEGGKRTLYLSALDDRVKVAVVSGYFTTLRAEIEIWDKFQGWDICNYVPGLLQYGDLPDVASLIAPRPLLIENGRTDPLYSLEAVEMGYKVVATAYKDLGYGDRFDFDLFEGPHAFSGRKSFDWVDKWL